MGLIKRIAPTSLSCPSCSALPIGARCPARCERNFVLGAWSASFKHSREAGLIVATDWDEVMHGQIAKICSRPECRVLVAYGQVEDSFLAFVAGEPTEQVVYYCFVKESYRLNGIARALFSALGVDPLKPFLFPAVTRALSDSSLRQKIPLARRDPAVGRYPKQLRRRKSAPP